MNSQTVLIKDALKSKLTFILFTGFIPISLFLKAGFINVAVIWFFAVCLFNGNIVFRTKNVGSYVLVFPILLFSLSLILLPFSSDISTTVDIIVRKIHLLLIPLGFAIVNKKISDKELNILNAIFLTGCMLCSLICIAGSLFDMVRLGGLDFQKAGYYLTGHLLTRKVNIEPIYFSMYCSFAFLITLTTPLILRPAIRVTIALYLAFFIILISAKTGVICVIVITVLWLLIKGYRKKIIYTLLGIFIIAGSVGFYRYSFLNEKFLASLKFHYTDVTGNISHHKADYLTIWSLALETIKQSPIIGYGVGDGQRALEETYAKNGYDIGLKDLLNPHNEFLSTTLDFGLVGLITMLAMLIFPLVQAIQKKDTLAIGYILIICFFFFIESVLVRQRGIVFFSFFYSLLLSRLNSGNRKQLTPER